MILPDLPPQLKAKNNKLCYLFANSVTSGTVLIFLGTPELVYDSDRLVAMGYCQLLDCYVEP